MRFIRSHAISLVALFVALSGTSYAVVSSLPANSVGTRQVKDHSLLRRDFKTSQLKRLHGPRGPQGVAGAAGAGGAKGDKGDTGATGPSEVLVKSLADGSISSNAAATLGTASPGAGSYLVRGRATIANNGAQAQIIKCRIDTSQSGGTVTHVFWLNPLGDPKGDTVEVWAERAITLTQADAVVSFACSRQSATPDYIFEKGEILLQRVGAVTALP